jgi:hypothetical protein
MDLSKRQTGLTPEEQELKERLMRTKLPSDEIAHGSGRVQNDFWKMPRPKISNGSLLEALLKDRETGRYRGP